MTVTTKNTGGTVTVSATVNEIKGESDVELYGAPLVTDLHISGTPEVGQTLQAEYTFTANGAGTDISTFQWQWQDGAAWKNVADGTARTFTLPASYAGYSIRVVVTPKGSTPSALTGVVQESPVVDAYGAPSVTDLRISGVPEVGQTLRVEYAFIANGTGADASTYIWARYEKSSWMPVEGASGREYTLRAGDAGYSIKAVVIPKGSSQSLTGVVQHSPAVEAYGSPEVTNLRISGTPEVGKTLRAEYTFTSNGTGADASTYIWARYEKSSWMPVEGASGREYTLRAGDAGYSIKAVVIPKGSSQSLTGAVQHSAAVEAYGSPEVTNLRISGTPEVGQTLTASYIFTANGTGTDASTFQWQWKDGTTWKNAAAAGSTAKSFTLPDSYAGYSVRVVVTPKGSSQPSLTGVAQESPAVDAYGTPSLTGLHITGTPKVGQTLRAEYTFTANGAGSDASTFQWQWQDGATWKNAAGGTARTFTLPDSYAGYSVRVVVTPKGSSQPSLTGVVQESPVMAAYSAPLVTGLRITGTPKVGQTLRAEYTFTANGAGSDASTFQWQWQDGATWKNAAGGTARTFTLPDSYAGYSVRVVVTPKGSSQPSLTGTVQESQGVAVYGLPSVTGLRVSGTPEVGQTLKAEYTFTANGSGTDVSTWQWQWKDGQTWRNVAGGTAKTFTLPDSYAGYDVRVAVTPKGSGQPLAGTEVFSHAVTIRSKPVPFVTNLGYSGKTGACNRITATYTYNANGGASEGNTIFQWKWGSSVVSNVQGVTLGYWGEVTLYVTPVNKDGIRGKTESKTFKNTGSSTCDW